LLFDFHSIDSNSYNVTGVTYNNDLGGVVGFTDLPVGTSPLVTLNNWLLYDQDGARKVNAVYSGVDTQTNQIVTSSVYTDTIILDRVKPGQSATSVIEGWTSVNNRAAFTWSDASDALSGVGGYNVYWGFSVPPVSWNYQPYHSYDPPVCPTTGIYYLQAQAVDRATNTGNWTTVLTYKYDGIAPTGSVSVNGSAPWTSRSLTLTLRAGDAHSGVSYYQINETGVLGADWQAVANTNTYSDASKAYTLTSPGNGDKKIYVWYRDAAGNVSARYDTGVINLQEPSGGSHWGSIIIKGDAEWTNTLDVPLTLNYDNAAAQMKIYNDLSASASAAWQTAGASVPSWLLSPGDGVKYVYVEYRDNSGNTWGPYFDTIKLDTTSPYERTVSGGIIINNGDVYTTSVSVNLTLDAVGADYMRFWNDVVSAEPAGDTGWVTYNTGWPWILNNSYGDKTVFVRFKDLAGNRSEIYADTINYVDVSTMPRVTPSIAIKAGATHTNVINNDISIYAPGAVEMRFANSADFSLNPSGWESFDIIKRGWSILPPPGDGVKFVWAVFRYADGATITVNDDIIYDTTPPTGDPANPPPGGGWNGQAAVKINNDAPYTASQQVELQLSAKDMQGQVDMLISNYADFRAAGGWEPYAPTRDWTLLPGSGVKWVYVRFRDEAGNIAEARDDINMDPSVFYFRFIEPDGYHDVASDNFTVSWEDAYPGDPNAFIELYYDTDKNASNGLSGKITANPVLVSNQINGVIWDTSTISTGKYYPYAIISGNNGELRVYSDYPVYVIHGGGDPSVDPGTDPELWTPNQPLPGDPPAILVTNPSAPNQTPADNLFTIYYEFKYTPSANDKTYIALWHDTDNDRLNGGQQLITANIDADSAAGVFNWNVTGLPAGIYYIYATISNNYYLRADYSAGWILLDGLDHKPGNGGTGEGIWSYPNPFSPLTRGEEAHIAYNVKEDGWTRVYIYNVRGERVWQTTNYAWAGRENMVSWDGRNARGQTAGNGIYIMLLTDEGRKILSRGRLTLLD
jgi:hypothetical protein